MVVYRKRHPSAQVFNGDLEACRNSIFEIATTGPAITIAQPLFVLDDG